MMMNKNSFLLVCMLGAYLVSCNIDENKSNAKEMAVAVQLQGKWLLQSYSQDGSEVLLDECEKSETIVFNNDYTIDFNYYNDKEEGKPCELSVVGSGHWKFSSNTEIEFDYSTEMYKDVFKVAYLVEGDILTLTTKEGKDSYSEIYIRQ